MVSYDWFNESGDIMLILLIYLPDFMDVIWLKIRPTLWPSLASILRYVWVSMVSIYFYFILFSFYSGKFFNLNSIQLHVK